jgi:hypothetical protein
MCHEGETDADMRHEGETDADMRQMLTRVRQMLTGPPPVNDEVDVTDWWYVKRVWEASRRSTYCSNKNSVRGFTLSINLILAGFRQTLMMMSFICSCRNKKQFTLNSMGPP